MPSPLVDGSANDIVEYDVSGAFDVVDVSSYMLFNYDSIDNKIYMDVSVNTNEKYGLNIGTYVIRDVPESHALAFLNQDENDISSEYFMYNGNSSKKVSNVAPDGNTYDFFWGNINLYVSGNFGQMSFYTNNGEFLNGRRKFAYSSTANIGYAIPNFTGISNYPTLSTDTLSDIVRTFYIDIYLVTVEVPYSYNITSYHFVGNDRNGELGISGEIDMDNPNPSLTFMLGDTVIFNFQYTNAYFTFGLYNYRTLLTDPQLITNNYNRTNETITWTPHLPYQNYFFYRSSNNMSFMNNTIRILPNTFDGYNVDISSVSPIEGSTVSANIDHFIVETTTFVNVDVTKQLYIINMDNGTTEHTYSGSDLVGSGSSTITLYTGFTNTNRLEFETNYMLVTDDGLFKNKYLSEIIDVSLVSFTTELEHDPSLLSIYPSSTDASLVPTDPVILTFNEPVNFLTSNNIYFQNIATSLRTLYTSAESSGNDLIIYNTNLDYESTYSLSIDENSIVDNSYIFFNVSESTILSTYSFDTTFDPRPKITSVDPSFGATDVSFDSIVSITFNEPVYLGTTGVIVIQNISDSFIFDSINISLVEDVSNQMSGIGTNTISITPASTFNVGTTYAILIDNTCFQDISDNFFVGIQDETYYNFTVV